MAAETPLVHRTVRTGAVLLIVAALQFVTTMFVVEGRFPGFNVNTTSILSLGGSDSPWAIAFNASLAALGVLAIFALLLIWSAFDDRSSRGIGLLCLMVASGAAAAAGILPLIPSYAFGSAQNISTDVAAVGAGVGLVVLSFAMHRQTRWRASRVYTFASGLVVLGSAALLAVRVIPSSLGLGGLERILVGVALLWPIAEGAHIALLHRFAPGLQVKVAAA